MRLIRWIVLVCVVLLLIYGASPYFSFWRFTVALRSGNSAAIGSRVDFPAVRASLKKQLAARIEREIALWEQTMLCAEVRESLQTFLFPISKAESKMLAVITKKKLAI